MAKNRDVNTVDTIIEKYTTEEIIAWSAKSLKEITRRSDERVANNEPYLLYLDLPNVLMIAGVLSKLDEKINGNKKQSVL